MRLDRSLARRMEAAEAADLFSMRQAMASLPENPYGLHVRRFGQLVALACPTMPCEGFINRVIGAGPDDLADLQEAIAWVRGHSRHCRVDINPFDTSRPFLAFLAREGFVTRGYTATLYGETAQLDRPEDLPRGVTVRRAATAAEFAFAAQAVPFIFEVTGDFWIRWQMDALHVTFPLPDWSTYVAYVDGQLAAFAQLHVSGGVGALVVAGTLPQYRGRGAQSALIRRRIADAAAAGCDLVVAQTGLGTDSQQNMLRAGLRVAYTKAEMTDRMPAKPGS